MKKIKKIVLVVSLVGTVVLLSLAFFRDTLYDYCFAEGRCWRFWNSLDGVGDLFFPILFLFLFSLITYKMRDEVFRAWWNFARWWVPVIMVVTLLLNNASGTGGGYIGMGQDFTSLVLGILYATLVIVSLVKIVRAYNKK
jgi:general stress protein CsbA